MAITCHTQVSPPVTYTLWGSRDIEVSRKVVSTRHPVSFHINVTLKSRPDLLTYTCQASTAWGMRLASAPLQLYWELWASECRGSGAGGAGLRSGREAGGLGQAVVHLQGPLSVPWGLVTGGSRSWPGPQGAEGAVTQHPGPSSDLKLIKGTCGGLSGFIFSAAAGGVLVPASGGGSSSSWRLRQLSQAAAHKWQPVAPSPTARSSKLCVLPGPLSSPRRPFPVGGMGGQPEVLSDGGWDSDPMALRLETAWGGEPSVWSTSGGGFRPHTYRLWVLGQVTQPL